MGTAEQEKLEELGYSMDFKVLDSGGYGKPAKYIVTVTKGNVSIETSYQSGWGNRIWKNQSLMVCMGAGYWEKYRKPGKIIGTSHCKRLKSLEDMEKDGDSGLSRQREIMNAFAKMTDPIPPTIDDIIHCLIMDSYGIRDGQTFEEWCDEYSYSSDSIKAANLFDECQQQYFRLLRLCGNQGIEELEEIIQDM